IFFQDQMGRSDMDWWLLPNPFMALFEMGSSHRRDFQELCVWFLAIWGVLVTALSIPWLVGQIQNFRPLKVKRPAPAAASEPLLDALPVPVEVVDAALKQRIEPAGEAS